MQGILQQIGTRERVTKKTHKAFGTKIGIFGKLFGCWHKELSRPFSDKRDSYRACTSCGARKKFDTSNFTTSGTFYYPPSVQLDRN